MSSQYERDFTASGALKRPGRIDLRIFQNVDNAGDGYPGLQKAIRNWVKYWLHNGVMDQALDMNSQNINNVNDLDVNGNLDLEGTLDVNGIADFHSALDMNSNNINNINNLDVDGDLDLEGDVDINGTTNLDNTDIDGTLDVSGVVDFHSNLDMNANDIQNATFDGLDLSGHSQPEIDILDGATVTTAELNKLDGATLSTAELNKLDGASVSTAELNILTGATVTTAELNKLDGFTGDVDDLNKIKESGRAQGDLLYADAADSLAWLTKGTNNYHFVMNGNVPNWEALDISHDSSPALGGDLDLNGHNIDFPTTANISDCLDDDTFATASATTLATSESIKEYADGRVEDDAYGPGWEGDTSHAPSQNTIYNMMDGSHAETEASDTLQHSNDTQRSSNNDGGWDVIKEIEIGHDLEGVRVKYDYRHTDNSRTAYWNLFVNDVEVGTHVVKGDTDWSTESEDHTGLSKGDVLTVKCKTTVSDDTMYCRNFRLYYDWVLVSDETHTNDDPV